MGGGCASAWRATVCSATAPPIPDARCTGMSAFNFSACVRRCLALSPASRAISSQSSACERSSASLLFRSLCLLAGPASAICDVRRWAARMQKQKSWAGYFSLRANQTRVNETNASAFDDTRGGNASSGRPNRLWPPLRAAIWCSVPRSSESCGVRFVDSS